MSHTSVASFAVAAETSRARQRTLALDPLLLKAALDDQSTTATRPRIGANI